ncbi:hypothetical protein BXU06_03845 [Aquaspirillum sp. LM1]|nr:hypothetical protein BXU06_03845 [Aquaspirillum sp. LM1]
MTLFALGSWAEKRCMADWLAASTKILADTAEHLPTPHDARCGTVWVPACAGTTSEVRLMRKEIESSVTLKWRAS